MYLRYISELEETMTAAKSWADKFRIVFDRKKLRVKANSDF